MRKRELSALPEAKAAKAVYVRENAVAYRVYALNRRSRKLCATPPWFGELDELALIEGAQLCDLRFAATGCEWQVDHLIPLAARKACGLHWGGNLQVIPRTLNAGKCNKMELTEPLEWLRHI
jgi:hypothetical protein